MSGGPSRRLFSLGKRRRAAAGPETDPPLARRQAARLAYLSVALGGLSHDLRGILSPALLAAERLQAHADPAVRRSADVLVRAVDRAIGALREDLGAMREGMPAVAHTQVLLRAAIEAAARPDLALVNEVPADAIARADPVLLAAAWSALFAHMRAHRVVQATVAAERTGRRWTVRVIRAEEPSPRYDPPQSPAEAAGAVDLAIARDLLRACGGELARSDETTWLATLGE